MILYKKRFQTPNVTNGISFCILGVSFINGNLNPALENNNHLPVLLDHDVIEQSAP